MKFEKCEICNIETNRFTKHTCRRCGKDVVCSGCPTHISTKEHLQTISNMNQSLWSSGFCTSCDKALIRDRKLESIGI